MTPQYKQMRGHSVISHTGKKEGEKNQDHKNLPTALPNDIQERIAEKKKTK